MLWTFFLLKVQVAKHINCMLCTGWLPTIILVLAAAVFLAAYCGSELVFLLSFVALLSPQKPYRGLLRTGEE